MGVVPLNTSPPEGELIETDDNLDTMWYTIDNGVTNISFTINGTIDPDKWLYHNNGNVTLIFYANDTVGNIGTAQIIIIKEALYPGTYSFNDDIVGGNPAGWSLYESGGNINVIDEKDGHRKVVELNDNSITNHTRLTQNFDDISSGTVYIEYWIYPENVEDGFYYFMHIYSSAGSAIRIYWLKDIGWIIKTATGTSIVAGTTNQWAHFKIELDIDNDDVSVWIDGVKEITEEAWDNFGDLAYLQFMTSDAEKGTFYVDAVGYSWDAN